MLIAKRIAFTLCMSAPIGLVSMAITGVAGYYATPLYYFFGGMMLFGFGCIIVGGIIYGLYSIWTDSFL
jgi:hypothetical protein